MISKKDVEHIARLARIELSDGEMAKFGKDLSDILAFVEKLGEVDTALIEPLTGGTNLENIMREDTRSGFFGEARLDEQGQSLIEAAPRRRDGSVEVPAVFQDH